MNFVFFHFSALTPTFMSTDPDCNTLCGRPEHQKQASRIPRPMEEQLTGQNRLSRVGKFGSGRRRRRCRQSRGSGRTPAPCAFILHSHQSSAGSLYLLAASSLQVDRSAARRLGCADDAFQTRTEVPAALSVDSERTAAPSWNFGCSMCDVYVLLPW